MNKTKGTFESPELWSPDRTQGTSLASVAPAFALSWKAMDKALNVILIVVVFVVMVSLGCTGEIAKITAHLRKPKGVAVAIMAQYGIMPLTAVILDKLFQLSATESLAILMRGCCPGGNLSNIFSLAQRGEVKLSVVVTTCSTVLAIALMPLLLYLYLGGLYEGDLEGKVLYKGIITSPVLMLNACAISIEREETTGHWLYHQGMVVLLLSTAAIIVLSVASAEHSIIAVFSPSLLGSSALMPFIGFLLAYVLSAIFKLNDQYVPPSLHSVTRRNREVGSSLLLANFYLHTMDSSHRKQIPSLWEAAEPRAGDAGGQRAWKLAARTYSFAQLSPGIVGPLYFSPLLHLLFQLGEGLRLILVFRIHAQMKQPNSAFSFAPVFVMPSNPNHIITK